jgi:hypothetical protein
MDSNQDDSMEDCFEVDSIDDTKEIGKGGMATPIFAFHPVLGHFSMGDISELMIQNIQKRSL